MKSKHRTPARPPVIGPDEGADRAQRLITASRELFQRLAGTTIKRTIADYRKTLRSFASGPGRTRRG